MAEALYRKYRPQVFEEVVGQEPIERTLKNAISQDKVSHAYLFCGPRGTGKTTTARLLAKALLCEKGPTPDPDGSCEDCQLVADGAHPDVYELDAASRTGVENVREEIISRVHFAPTRGRYKVYIIDEVHMLSTAAFNALLKTLEEPPSHVVFVLCTTDPQKVPETIHSRCQRFDFHRISPESMVARLGAICIAEDVEFEGEALDLIAQRADGGLRDALTSLEQIIAFEDGKVTLAGAERLLGSIDSNEMAEIVSYIGRRDIANCFRWTAAYVETGADLAHFVRDMAEHVRNLYVMALVGDDVELDVPETSRQELAGELAWFGPERAARLLGVLGDLMAELKTTSNPRLAFEIALTRMVRPDSDLTIAALAERVEALESGYSAVAHVLPGGPAPSHAAKAAPDSPASAPAQVSEPAGRPSVGAGAAPAAERTPEPSPTRSDAASAGEGRPRGTQSAAVDAQPDAVAFAAEARPAHESVSTPAAASAAIPAAASTAAPGPGSKLDALANPAALQRIWQAAMADVKRQKQSHGVLFMSAKASYDAAQNAVNVTFPEGSTFAFNAAQKPEVQDAVAKALAKAAGCEVPFVYRQGNAAGSAQAAATRERAAQAAEPAPASSREPMTSSQPARAAGENARQATQPAEAVQAAAASKQREAAQPTAAQPAANPRSDASTPAYDDVPYEQVPYEDMPYDPVPYDEYDAPPSSPAPAPAAEMSASAPAAAQQAQPDAGTSASPAEPNLTPDGALQEDPAALQAMLQASFGSSVILSETTE